MEVGGVLNWRELLGRRAKRSRRLAELYEGLYWDLAEELAGMHKRFRGEEGRSGWRGGESAVAPVPADSEAGAGEPADSVKGYFARGRRPLVAGGAEETTPPPDSSPREPSPALPAFDRVEAAILDGAPGLPAPRDDKVLCAQRARAAAAVGEVAELEVSAQGALARQLTSLGGLAVVAGRKVRYVITKPEVSLGRSTSSSQVDVDVAAEGDASRASRQAALLKLDHRGIFHLWNTGRKKLFVNQKEVGVGQSVRLQDGSLLEVGGLAFLFLLNAHVTEVFRKLQSGPEAGHHALRESRKGEEPPVLPGDGPAKGGEELLKAGTPEAMEAKEEATPGESAGNAAA